MKKINKNDIKEKIRAVKEAEENVAEGVSEDDILKKIDENTGGHKKELSEENTKAIRKFLKISSIVGLVLTVVLIVWGYVAGIFTNTEKMKALIDACGIFGPFVFTLVQAIQVIIPIIPGSVGCPASVYMFAADGSLWGHICAFLYNYIGIMAGSVIAFLIARRYGYPLVRALSEKKNWDKYMRFLYNPKKFDRLFIILTVVPFTPADFLCYLAGLSNMSFKKYMLIITFAKPATILIYTYVLYSVSDLLFKILPQF